MKKMYVGEEELLVSMYNVEPDKHWATIYQRHKDNLVIPMYEGCFSEEREAWDSIFRILVHTVNLSYSYFFPNSPILIRSLFRDQLNSFRSQIRGKLNISNKETQAANRIMDVIRNKRK